MAYPQRFSSEDVLFFGPMQLDAVFFFYNYRLAEITWELIDNLEYISNHPLTNKIKTSCLGDLYFVLDESDSFNLLDDIDPEYLSILCHNHRLLVNCLQHYNDTHPLLDNVLTSRKLMLSTFGDN